MIASMLLIFVTVTILNYAAKRYLPRTISRKYSHSWQHKMRTCDMDMIMMFRLTKEEKQTENWLNQDFSQDDNNVKKKKKVAARALATKRYSATKTKARNFLTIIANRRYKISDINSGNFVTDVYSFMLQNLNPLMIDRKFDNENDRQCIKMLWQRCLLQQYTRYTFLYGNVLALTQK